MLEAAWADERRDAGPMQQAPTISTMPSVQNDVEDHLRQIQTADVWFRLVEMSRGRQPNISSPSRSHV